jgi:hypothetical protein
MNELAGRLDRSKLPPTMDINNLDELVVEPGYLFEHMTITMCILRDLSSLDL